MRAALGLRLRVVFLLKLEDARVGLSGHFGQHQQVIATEALRGFPLRFVLVEAGEGDLVPRAVFGFVTPNRGLSSNGTGMYAKGCRPEQSLLLKSSVRVP